MYYSSVCVCACLCVCVCVCVHECMGVTALAWQSKCSRFDAQLLLLFPKALLILFQSVICGPGVN